MTLFLLFYANKHIKVGDLMSKSNSSEFIDQLYREMHRKLFTRAYHALKDKCRAEEAVQDTFHIALIREHMLVNSKNPQGWIMNTLLNVLRNATRSIAAYDRVFVDSKEADIRLEELSVTDDYTYMYYSDILHKQEYEILRMYCIEGLSVHEIAAIYGISSEACKKRIQRSRADFRIDIKNN